mmetsp:Transcript_18002/g.45110  ORF Transcript_18002/g.45110 Transcript_18002/m.45110 type:complete len:253 (-) Transcript_18002:384-1142(-)
MLRPRRRTASSSRSCATAWSSSCRWSASRAAGTPCRRRTHCRTEAGKGRPWTSRMCGPPRRALRRTLRPSLPPRPSTPRVSPRQRRSRLPCRRQAMQGGQTRLGSHPSRRGARTRTRWPAAGAASRMRSSGPSRLRRSSGPSRWTRILSSSTRPRCSTPSSSTRQERRQAQGRVLRRRRPLPRQPRCPGPRRRRGPTRCWLRTWCWLRRAKTCRPAGLWSCARRTQGAGTRSTPSPACRTATRARRHGRPQA